MIVDRDGRHARTCALVRELCERYHGASADDEFVEALFLDDADGWLAGIAELSVSFCDDRPAAVRAMSEILRRHVLEPDLAEAGLAWGTAVLRCAARAGSYDLGRFRTLYKLIYASPAPEFRFGIAAELGGAAPVIKVYFDLHAVPAEHRRCTLARFAELVGEAAGLEAWARACPAIDLDTSRVIGVDFGAGDTVRTKFYWGTRRLDWAAIRALAGDRHGELVERLEREVVAGPPSPAVLISMCGRDGEHSLKLDVCVARLFEDDGRAHDAIARLCGSAIGGPLALVTGGLAPRATRCVQQYLGIELPPDRAPRVTMYYRPLGLPTEHLNPELRPRRCA